MIESTCLSVEKVSVVMECKLQQLTTELQSVTFYTPYMHNNNNSKGEGYEHSVLAAECRIPVVLHSLVSQGQGNMHGYP
jgi:hypothetical protein